MVAKPEPYAIFFSYACYDGKLLGGAPFNKFTAMLRDLVGGKIRDSRPHLSFVDQIGIKVGDEWESVLADGVRTSEVLVCLVSPRYLGSVWCGRELEVFFRRITKWKDQGGTPGHPGRFVFLVWWEKPKDRKELPKKLGAYNPEDNAFPPSYVVKGVRQLASLNTGQDDLLEIADTLAERIAETLDGQGRLAFAEEIDDFSSFPSAFEEAVAVQPYQIAVLATPPGGDAWKPVDSPLNIAQIVDRVVGRINVMARALDVHSGVAAGLEAARENRQLMLVIAEASDGPNHSVLSEVNACALPNLAVLAIYSGAGNQSSLTPEAWARRFPEGSIPEATRGGRIALIGPRELESALEALITRVRQRLIQSDKPARAEDAALAAEASNLGVPIDKNPSLAGITTTSRP